MEGTFGRGKALTKLWWPDVVANLSFDLNDEFLTLKPWKLNALLLYVKKILNLVFKHFCVGYILTAN